MSKTRAELIADAVAAKKRATDATAAAVTPAKAVPMRIPAELNATSGVSKKDANKAKRNDTPTQTDKEPLVKKPKAKDVPKEVAAEADAELDASVAPKPKKAKDANELSVSDVAREVGIEPKVARQRLRKSGDRAPDGRWPTVIRGTKAHTDLIARLKGDTSEDTSHHDTKAAAKPVPVADDDEPEDEGIVEEADDEE